MDSRERADIIKAKETYGSGKKAAASLGMSKTTFYEKYKVAMAGLEQEVEVSNSVLSDGHDTSDIDALLDRCSKAFNRTEAKWDARRWYEVKVNERLPYGVIVFGDPHMGDPGANMPLLLRHIEVANRDHVYGLNIGDATNNWVGGLMRKYADQATTKEEERILIKWLMTEAGIKWLCWLLGNHDEWNDGAAIQRLIGGDEVPIISWDAQFRITHPTGTECRVDASHGRKGTSIWNELHGTLRDAMLNEAADIFITGHTHNYACQDMEIAKRRQAVWLLQVSGYKVYDTYAQRYGFPTYHRGSSAMLIIDPREDAPRRIPFIFEDVEAGYDYIMHLRSMK